MTGSTETLRAQRKALRLRMNAKRREVAQRMANLPAVKKRQSRRRKLLAAAILILLLLLSRCSCTDPPPPPQPARQVVVKVEKVVPPRAKPPRAQPTHIASRPRPPYKADSPMEPPWVEAFRLQVAARSQRLAECFVGVSKPGAIRWTASLTAETGAVFDHHIEPLPPADDLTSEQQRCVVNVLAKPGYQKLAANHAGALPETVSLVLEF